MSRYFFRLDDIAPNMNWDKFNSLAAIFKKYGVKPLLAVIPENQDPELLNYSFSPNFWQVVNQLKGDGWIVAQHGYQHLYKTKNGGILGINKKGEFSGLDFETQKRMIDNGSNIMREKIGEPKIFVSPGHSFDKNTIKALKEKGFNYISDGIALYPFRKWDIIWLPQIMWRPRKWLFGMITIALHSNTMAEKDFEDLEEFIKENLKKIGDFSELMNWYPRANIFKKLFVFRINLIFKPFWWLAFKLKIKSHDLSK